jgi:hypothetical protein
VPPPAPKVEEAPVMDALPVDDPEATWRDLPLKFAEKEEQKSDLDLEQHKD